MPIPAHGAFPGGRAHPGACPFGAELRASPTAGPAPLLVAFSATVSEGVPGSYDWSFGDGSFWNASGAGAADPVHSYTLPGEYNASVLVDEAGCTVGAAAAVAAVAGPISVVCATSATTGRAPLTVSFNCTSHGGSGTFVSSVWTFGDGGTGSGLGPVVYTYQHVGRFTAVLNVTDSLGHWSLAAVPVDVEGGGGGPPSLASQLTGPGALLALGATLAIALGLALAFRTGARRGSGTNPASRGALPEPPPGPAPPSAPAPDAGPETPQIVPILAEGPAVPVPSPRTVPNPETLRLTERVVLHLGRLGRLHPDDLAPTGRTQAGMSEMLEVGQNSLTNVLRRLEAADILWHEVRHVRDRPRRLKVYGLTERGEALARDLRGRGGRPGDRPPPGGRDAPARGVM